MTLKEFFRKKPSHPSRTSEKGRETDWLDFCQFTLRGPQFLVVDAAFLPSQGDGLLIKASRGIYIVRAKVIAYGADRRFSRLRVLRQGATAVLGKKVGETWTDTARTALCDYAAFRKAWGQNNEASSAKIERFMEQAEEQGIAVLDETVGAVAPFVPSGFGDGNYPVYELLEGHKRAGFEIEFIKGNTPYAFGRKVQKTPKGQALPSTAADESANLLNQMLGQIREALEVQAKGPKRPTKRERKERVAEVIEAMEQKLVADLEAAAAEFREEMVKARSKATPPRMAYTPTADDSFLKTPQALARLEQLQKAGFVPTGVFVTDWASAAKVAGFIHPGKRLTAAVTSTSAGLFCEVGADYRNGSYVVVTDETSHGFMERPHWMKTIHKSGKSVNSMLQMLVKVLPKKPRAFVSQETYRKHLEDGANRHLQWLFDKGGMSKEELRGLGLMRNPSTTITDEWLQERRLEAADRALYNWLRLQPGLEFRPEDVLGRLVIIHDEMTPDFLRTVFSCIGRDHKLREEAFKKGNAREAFARINEERGRFRKVASKTSGLAADYYLALA